MYISAQIIGILALACTVISFQQKTHKRILFFQLVSEPLFVLHFCLLGAYTGAILNAIAAFRSVIFYNKGKAWADNMFWLWFFCIVSVLAVVFTWDGAISIFPAFGMVLTSVAFWINEPKLVRRIAFPSSPLWLVYNVINKSYGGVITEVINMLSIIIAMIRLDFKKENKTEVC